METSARTPAFMGTPGTFMGTYTIDDTYNCWSRSSVSSWRNGRRSSRRNTICSWCSNSRGSVNSNTTTYTSTYNSNNSCTYA
jgi:hypothetical protein